MIRWKEQLFLKLLLSKQNIYIIRKVNLCWYKKYVGSKENYIFRVILIRLYQTWGSSSFFSSKIAIILGNPGVEIQNLFDYLIKKYQFLTILQLADFEHHVVRRGLCPLDRFCSKDSDCVDLHDINCLCYVGYYGGCFCSLAGQCVITDWSVENKRIFYNML